MNEFIFVSDTMHRKLESKIMHLNTIIYIMQPSPFPLNFNYIIFFVFVKCIFELLAEYQNRNKTKNIENGTNCKPHKKNGVEKNTKIKHIENEI